MKQILLAMACVVMAQSAEAQNWQGPTPLGNYSTDGGIMTFRGWPQRAALAAGWNGLNPLYSTAYLGFNLVMDGPNLTNIWTYEGANGVNGGNAIIGCESGELMFVCKPSTGGARGTMTHNDIRSNVRMRITPDGRMVIGRSYVADAPQIKGDYKLYVESGILTEKVTVAVANSNDWADYVFDKDYKMMPLPELEHYVLENKHLPGVPSAQEVVAHGLDVKKMDAKLLEKVEELTLLAIQQQKEIVELKNAINSKRKSR